MSILVQTNHTVVPCAPCREYEILTNREVERKLVIRYLVHKFAFKQCKQFLGQYFLHLRWCFCERLIMIIMKHIAKDLRVDLFCSG